ncbi:hypothetical protein DSECCO2_548810 [anaerobic digester metagenome]
MVTDIPAQQFIHPNGVLLALIQVFYSQPSQVKSRKSLVRAVIIGAYKTVERAVIAFGKPVLKLRRLIAQPVGKAAPHLVYLGIGKLYRFRITHFDLLHFPVDQFIYFFGDVGRGVLQGMFHQVYAVKCTAL